MKNATMRNVYTAFFEELKPVMVEEAVPFEESYESKHQESYSQGVTFSVHAATREPLCRVFYTPERKNGGPLLIFSRKYFLGDIPFGERASPEIFMAIGDEINGLRAKMSTLNYRLKGGVGILSTTSPDAEWPRGSSEPATIKALMSLQHSIEYNIRFLKQISSSNLRKELQRVVHKVWV